MSIDNNKTQRDCIKVEDGLQQRRYKDCMIMVGAALL